MTYEKYKKRTEKKKKTDVIAKDKIFVNQVKLLVILL